MARSLGQENVELGDPFQLRADLGEPLLAHAGGERIDDERDTHGPSLPAGRIAGKSRRSAPHEFPCYLGSRKSNAGVLSSWVIQPCVDGSADSFLNENAVPS